MAATDADVPSTPEHQGDAMDWRKSERQRLIAARLAMSAAERRRHTARIEAGLAEAVGNVRGRTVGVYWPFRGEPNLRRWMEWVLACGGACALPVVMKVAEVGVLPTSGS
jgi:5-formyltetrahydrofolate cyclo-ligase